MSKLRPAKSMKICSHASMNHGGKVMGKIETGYLKRSIRGMLKENLTRFQKY